MQASTHNNPTPPIKIVKRFSAWIWSSPQVTEHRLLKLLRDFLRIHLIVIQEFKLDRIPLRSSALTFTVVLSMVPMLALGTAVLKGLGASDHMRQAAYTFIEQLETTALPMAEIILPTQKPPAPAPDFFAPKTKNKSTATSTASKLPATLSTHLKKAVDIVFDYVEKTNFATLGILGIVGLLLSVISVLGSIEAAMNDIWQTDQGRSLRRRVMDYLALMILLPITINVGMATMATLQSPALHLWATRIVPGMGPFMLNVLPILAVILTFTALYIFLPYTRVKPLSALAGGFFGGIFWLLAQALYLKLQFGVARYNAIYGSFATLPLFLLWIYVGWMIFLAGAEMSFACQVRQTYLWKKRPLTPISKLAISFDIIKRMLADYQDSQLTTRAALVDFLGKADEHIKEIIDNLENGGIIRLVKRGRKKGYVPSGPPENIDPLEISRLILDYEEIDLSPGNPADAVRQAITVALANKKINPQTPTIIDTGDRQHPAQPDLP